MKRVVAVNSNCYHGFTIEEAIDGISAAGFRYIELTATKGWTEHVFPTMSLSYLAQIKERCKEKGLIPIALSGHCNLMDKERINDFIDNMKLAHYFECNYIISSIGEAHLHNENTVMEDELVEQLKALEIYLEEYDLQLVLEVHGAEYGTGASLCPIIEKVGSPRIGMNYDTGNAIFYGNTVLEEDMEQSMKYIQYVHIKDKDGEQDEWNFPALGKGKIDFKKIEMALNKEGNGCPLSIEIEFTPKGPKDLEEVNEALRESYVYLQNIGMDMEAGIC